jgi:hypothetical protein
MGAAYLKQRRYLGAVLQLVCNVHVGHDLVQTPCTENKLECSVPCSQSHQHARPHDKQREFRSQLQLRGIREPEILQRPVQRGLRLSSSSSRPSPSSSSASWKKEHTCSCVRTLPTRGSISACAVPRTSSFVVQFQAGSSGSAAPPVLLGGSASSNDEKTYGPITASTSKLTNDCCHARPFPHALKDLNSQMSGNSN